MVAPQIVDQPIGRDNLVPPDDKEAQESALLRACKPDLSSVGPSLEGPEDPEFHALSSGADGNTRTLEPRWSVVGPCVQPQTINEDARRAPMHRLLALGLAAAALTMNAAAVLAHDDRIAYVCTKADGDHIFLTADRAATFGLTTSVTATTWINLEFFGAVCRIE